MRQLISGLHTRPNPDVTCSYEHTLANEYETVCGVTVQYDNTGNLTLDKSGYVYNYDYENRLISISKNGQSKATFEYDALGRRIEKVITGSPTTTTRFYYDDQRIVLQTDVSTSETDQKYFIYGNYIDEVLLMHNLAGTNIGDFYYGHDHLYSPAVLFDSTGTPVERYEYDVYGQYRVLNSNFIIRASSLYGNPYGFTGRELDSFDNNALKIMYYRARYYDPQTGRFLQRDPLQYVDGMNLYEYVGSMPLLKVDPRGNTWRKGDFWDHYFNGNGESVDLGSIGLLDGLISRVSSVIEGMNQHIHQAALSFVDELNCSGKEFTWGMVSDTITQGTNILRRNPFSVYFLIGGIVIQADYECTVNKFCCCNSASYYCDVSFSLPSERFKDPWDIGNIFPDPGDDWDPFGHPYSITGTWDDFLSGERPCQR